MHIAFTGAHSTGKSSLIAYLKQHTNISEHFTFVDSVTRELRRQGFTINEEATDATQQAMISAHLALLHKNENKDYIADRCLLDVCAYTFYLFNKHAVTADTLGRALNSLENLAQYDILFYLKPEFDVVNDGVRSLSPEFRDDIADIFEALMYPVSRQVEVIVLHGSIEERAAQVLKELRNRGVQC